LWGSVSLGGDKRAADDDSSEESWLLRAGERPTTRPSATQA